VYADDQVSVMGKLVVGQPVARGSAAEVDFWMHAEQGNL